MIDIMLIIFGVILTFCIMGLVLQNINKSEADDRGITGHRLMGSEGIIKASIYSVAGASIFALTLNHYGRAAEPSFLADVLMLISAPVVLAALPIVLTQISLIIINKLKQKTF